MSKMPLDLKKRNKGGGEALERREPERDETPEREEPSGWEED